MKAIWIIQLGFNHINTYLLLHIIVNFKLLKFCDYQHTRLLRIILTHNTQMNTRYYTIHTYFITIPT